LQYSIQLRRRTVVIGLENWKREHIIWDKKCSLCNNSFGLAASKKFFFRISTNQKNELFKSPIFVFFVEELAYIICTNIWRCSFRWVFMYLTNQKLEFLVVAILFDRLEQNGVVSEEKIEIWNSNYGRREIFSRNKSRKCFFYILKTVYLVLIYVFNIFSVLKYLVKILII
jgi:hypothetical protein